MNNFKLAHLTKYLFVMILIFCPNLLQAQEYPWQLRIHKEGIEVYTRKVEASPMLEYKAKMMVDKPMDQVIALFENEQKMTSWFYQCVSFKVIEEAENKDHNLFYFVIHLPWPVAERDSIFRRIKSVDPITGEISYTLVSLPDQLPKQKGRIRVQSLKTLWKFTPLPNGQTEIYFQQHSDPGGSIPSFIVNKLVVDIPFNSLKDLRKLL